MFHDVYWQAITEHDSNFDFQFYYGVNTSKIFCKPSCKSTTPLRTNVIYFDNLSSAYNEGYQACKCCKPECHAKQDTGLLKLLHACRRIEGHNQGPLTAVKLASSIGLTQYQLNRLF